MADRFGLFRIPIKLIYLTCLECVCHTPSYTMLPHELDKSIPPFKLNMIFPSFSLNRNVSSLIMNMGVLHHEPNVLFLSRRIVLMGFLNLFFARAPAQLS